MKILLSYFIILILFSTLLIFLTKRIKYLSLIKKKGVLHSKKFVFNLYLSIIALIVFVTSFIVNILFYTRILQTEIVTGNTASISCFVFLLIFLISNRQVTKNNHILFEL